MDDYQQLGVGKSASVVIELEFRHWGREVVLHCLYHPLERRPYTLHFKNCMDVRLDPLEDGIRNGSDASLIGIALGSNTHPKAAIVTTNAFELSLLYGEWDLKWT